MQVYTVTTFTPDLYDTVINSGDILIIKEFIDQQVCNRAVADIMSIELDNITKPNWNIPNFKSSWPGDCDFDYYKLSNVPAVNSDALLEIYNAMSACMILIHGPPTHKPAYHLELLHYHNGGYFKKHTHDRVPQMVGMILQLSKQGVDYTSGGTVFYNNGVSIDVSQHSDQGDIVMFRYDIEHEVLPVIGKNGRWSAVLPYY